MKERQVSKGIPLGNLITGDVTGLLELGVDLRAEKVEGEVNATLTVQDGILVLTNDGDGVTKKGDHVVKLVNHFLQYQRILQCILYAFAFP